MLGNRFKILRFFIFFIFAVANGQVTIDGYFKLVKDESCFDANDGAISKLTASGTGLLTYKWTYTGSGTFDSTKQGSLDIFGLSPGDYSLTVTDQSTSPTSSVTYPVISIIEKTVQIEIIDSSPSIQYLSCFGDSDGYISITRADYPSILQAEWFLNGQLIPSWFDKTSISDLGPGTYKVVVTDTESPTCFLEKSFEIIEPDVITATAIFQVSQVKCKGDSNGVATVTPSGGTGVYTYLWDTGATTQTATDLAVGEHTVTIKDFNGCTNPDPIKVMISEPPSELTATITLSDVKCNGDSNGEAIVKAEGGTSPYTYSWDSSTPTGFAKVTNLIAGPHTVTIYDANGCDYQITFSITEPIKLTALEIANSPVSCNGGSDGYSEVSPSGGTPPYRYYWGQSSTSTDLKAIDLKKGFHRITITDLNGCVATTDIIINEPPAITAEIKELKSVTCSGDANGSAGVIPSGGMPPYTYSWDKSTTSIGQIALDLPAGTNIVTVTDANNCEFPISVIITGPKVITATAVQVSPVKCKGDADGEATVTASGGTPPYTYSWDTGATTQTATDLAVGEHTVTIKDFNGCTNPDPIKVMISEPPSELTATITLSDVKCNGDSNGEAIVKAEGGTSPYTYSWDNSSPSDSPKFTNLKAGPYTVEIIDANGNGCSILKSFEITEPNALSASAIEDSPVKCKGYFNGEATVTVEGGTTPYSYFWDRSNSESATASDLGAGLHKITIRDANNCETYTEVTIKELNSLTAIIGQLQAVSCNGKSDGSAKVTPSGGIPPYLYSWDNSASFTPSFTANNLAAGTHTVKIIDSNGCDVTASVEIMEPDPLIATVIKNSAVKCKGEKNGLATISVFGGTTPYSYWWENSTSTTDTATDLAAGKHIITITDANGCVFDTDVMISEPTALALTADVQPITCNTGGSITVNVTGGVSTNYFYTWEGPLAYFKSGAGLKSISNILDPGTYKLTVTDDNGCPITKFYTLNAYVPLEYTGNTSIVFDTCDDAPTFEVAISDIRGGLPFFDLNGNPYYNYEWFGPNNFRTNEAIIPIEPGTYTLIIKDSKNCESSPIGFTVSTPYGPIVVSEEIGKVSCDSQNNDGYISIDVNGGNTPYIIKWEKEIPSTAPGNTNPTYTTIGQNVLRVNNLMEGRYRLTVTSNLPTCSDNNPAYKFQTFYTVSTENTIRILENPVLDNKLCTGNSGTLTVKVIDENEGPVSFYYNGLVATSEDLGNSNYLVYIDNPIVDGILNIVNEVGCGEAVVINISVVEPSFDISSEGYDLNGIVNLNEAVTFINTSTEDFLRLEWNFGDGSPIDETDQPKHAYDVSGIYDATLRFYNEFECYKEITLQIKVGSGSSVRFPDIFTPNRDGINDYFESVMIGIARFDFEVYDLWNNLIYTYNHTSGPIPNNWGWDGNLPNGDAFTGKIFKYVFIGYDFSDEQVTINNQALLLR